MVLTTDLHLALRLRKGGAVLLLPLYAYMAWTRKTVPLPFMLQPLYVSIYRARRWLCLF